MATVKHISVECDTPGCKHVIVMSGGSVDAAGARRLARDDHGWHVHRRDYCPECKATRVDGRGIKQ